MTTKTALIDCSKTYNLQTTCRSQFGSYREATTSLDVVTSELNWNNDDGGDGALYVPKDLRSGQQMSWQQVWADLHTQRLRMLPIHVIDAWIADESLFPRQWEGKRVNFPGASFFFDHAKRHILASVALLDGLPLTIGTGTIAQHPEDKTPILPFVPDFDFFAVCRH